MADCNCPVGWHTYTLRVCMAGSEAFKAGVQKNMNDMMAEQRRLIAANTRMAESLATKDADLAALRGELNSQHARQSEIVAQYEARLSSGPYKSGELIQIRAELAERTEEVAGLKAVLAEGRQLAYEIEGGNRWPVEWDDDTRIEPPLLAFKNALEEIGQGLPVWKRKGSGWERTALSPAPEVGKP